jgi:ANTAR domain-containing protein
VNDPRLLRILSMLSAAGPAAHIQGLCAVSAEVVHVAGAGVMVEDTDHRAPLCFSDATSARILDLCYTLGEGPGLDAHQAGAPVAEPDLALPRRTRWPAFAPSALDAGAAAVFSFPLQLGGVRLGALTLHQDRPGPLSDDQHADALAMASVVVNAILAEQADAPPGALARDLEALSDSKAEVHQACGMLSVQLDVGLAEASVRLRAHAYAQGRPLAEVARDVVARRLRLER